MATPCVGPTTYPDDRPRTMCQCERKGLKPHVCLGERTYYLLRPTARPCLPGENLTRHWNGGNLPLCRSCAKQYAAHGYQSIVRVS